MKQCGAQSGQKLNLFVNLSCDNVCVGVNVIVYVYEYGYEKC